MMLRRRANPGARELLCALAATTLLATAAVAEEPVLQDFCCICDCRDFGTVSGAVPEGGTCVDVPQVDTVNCSAACDTVFCLQAGAEIGSCSAVPGCPQAEADTPVMAPVASPWGLTALVLLLACLGVMPRRLAN